MLRSKPATITAVTSTTCHRLIQSKNLTARGYNKKLSAPLWGAYPAGRRLGHHEGSWPDSYAPDSDGRACYRQLRRITLLSTSVNTVTVVPGQWLRYPQGVCYVLTQVAYRPFHPTPSGGLRCQKPRLPCRQACPGRRRAAAGSDCPWSSSRRRS